MTPQISPEHRPLFSNLLAAIDRILTKAEEQDGGHWWAITSSPLRELAMCREEFVAGGGMEGCQAQLWLLFEAIDDILDFVPWAGFIDERLLEALKNQALVLRSMLDPGELLTPLEAAPCA